MKCEPKKTQVYHKKNNFCLLFANSRAPRQDDGAFEDLSPRTSFFPRRDHFAWSTDDRNLTDFLVI